MKILSQPKAKVRGLAFAFLSAFSSFAGAATSSGLQEPSGTLPVQIGALGRYHHGPTMDSRTSATTMGMGEDETVYLAGTASTGSNKELFVLKVAPRSGIEWARTYNNRFNLQEEMGALVVDTADNVYAAGSSEGGFNIQKYASDGNRVWVVDSMFSDELTYPRVAGIAFASDGNLIVSGNADNNGASEFVVINLRANGELVWMKHWAPTGLFDCVAEAMAVDGDGNILLTGASGWASRDYTTVKLDPNGNPLWTATYGVEAGSDELPSAMTVDPAGNVFVTGVSKFGSTTIKYSPGGVELWKFDSAKTLRPKRLICGNSGELYLAGFHEEDERIFYTLIRLSSGGAVDWERDFDSQMAADYYEHSPVINLDSEGNIYMPAKLKVGETAVDYVLLKYSPAGTLDWRANYSPMSNMLEESIQVEIGRSGRSFVAENTGRGDLNDLLGTWFNSEGEFEGGIFYNHLTGSVDQPLDFRLDSSGDAIAVGSSYGLQTEEDIATVKFDENGSIQWIRRYDGTANRNDVPVGIEVDPEGNYIVVGTSNETSEGLDIVVLKYSASGELLWKKFYRNAPFRDDRARAMAVDAQGNVIVGGLVNTTFTDTEYHIVKFSPFGEQVWVARRTNSVDKLKVDASGNIYVIGQNESRFELTKINPSGEEQWSRNYPETSSESTYNLNLIEIDIPGNVYICGSKDTYFPQAGAGISEILLLKYDGSGNLASERLYERNFNPEMYAIPKAFKVNADGSVYVLADGRREDYDGVEYLTFLLKFAAGGEVLWRADKTGLYDRFSSSSLAVDANDNVYLTALVIPGLTLTREEGYILAMKYSGAGTKQWETIYNGPGNGSDYPVAMALDQTGSIYILGASTGIGTGMDFVVVKLVENVPPRLQAFSGSELLWLSWSSAATNLELDTTESLTPPVLWQPMRPDRVQENGQSEIFVSDQNRRRFFRLQEHP